MFAKNGTETEMILLSCDNPPSFYPKFQIIGFTDKGYIPIAKKWHEILVGLGYKDEEIVFACHDEESFEELREGGYANVERLTIENPDYKHFTFGFWRQIMLQRLEYSVEKLRAGYSVLITDIDNVFMRHVPLSNFWCEGHNVIHAHEMKYPKSVHHDMGFVVCSGHQWLRSSNETIAYMEAVIQSCGDFLLQRNKCDDQVAYNRNIFNRTRIIWNKDPNRTDAPRVSLREGHVDMAGLLMEELVGRAPGLNNASIKIWHRDFATRWSRDPKICPSENNWVAMPVEMDAAKVKLAVRKRRKYNKVKLKLAHMDAWRDLCGPAGQLPRAPIPE